MYIYFFSVYLISSCLAKRYNFSGVKKKSLQKSGVKKKGGGGGVGVKINIQKVEKKVGVKKMIIKVGKKVGGKKSGV